MKFVQDTIEKKLSQLLNRQVTFERLSVSLLSGQVEAEGMMVAGDEPNRPLLSVTRISAKIAIAKALAGQISIKSLVIEGPALNLTRMSDGSINL
ncbi:MAG TPA: AsmA family protein, partial [Tepidisphaeraceae bacterium]